MTRSKIITITIIGSLHIALCLTYDFLENYHMDGKHDIVAIVEAPTDEAIASAMFSTGSLGNVRTETLKAFSTSEVASILET